MSDSSVLHHGLIIITFAEFDIGPSDEASFVGVPENNLMSDNVFPWIYKAVLDHIHFSIEGFKSRFLPAVFGPVPVHENKAITRTFGFENHVVLFAEVGILPKELPLFFSGWHVTT